MSKGRSGVHAAIASIAITAGLGVVAVAGADESAPADVYVRDSCFSEDPNTTCPAGETASVTAGTGEAVTFRFQGSLPHNAQGDDPATWKAPDTGYVTNGTAVETFNNPGSYPFHCEVHPQMTGTITVTGDPIPTETATATPTATATSTATATPTATPTSIPQPGGGGHTTTPPPSGGTDTVKPTVRRVSSKALRRAVRVSFTLSEPATVTIRVKRRGSTRVLKAASVQARAGTRSVTLRSKRLKKGRYTVEVQARDAFGNRSALARKRLTLRR
ncbi:MAG TPA: hypothetical protein VNO82_15775 [Solirubrobacteraceae bacterium]|nr:hypothetical protein [Solirubrobacteraceae bacterium]